MADDFVVNLLAKFFAKMSQEHAVPASVEGQGVLPQTLQGLESYYSNLIIPFKLGQQLIAVNSSTY